MNPEVLKRLLAEDQYGLLKAAERAPQITSADRTVAGFDEIVAFFDAHGREPDADAIDMSEARLAWRLEAIRQNPEQCAQLSDADIHNLLTEPEPPASLQDVLASDPFGLLSGGDPSEDLFELRHVPPPVKTMPEDIAKRERTDDFEKFQPLFVECHRQLASGERKLRPFSKPSNIKPGRFYLLNGLLVLVAAQGEQFDREKGNNKDARLRCIFENGTESGMFQKSLARQLYEHGKLITEPEPLRSSMEIDSETPMGVLYVLRSLSEDPQVTAIPNLHKIGFTTGTTVDRIRGASKSDTYLRAEVEIVAEYQLPAVIAPQIEHLLHRIFSDVRLDVRYELAGIDVSQCIEWFSVPLSVIDEAIQLFSSGAIVNYRYDPESQRLVLG